MTTREKTKIWKEKVEADSNITASMETCHYVWEKTMKKAKTAAAAARRTEKKTRRAEAEHRTAWRIETEAKDKRKKRSMRRYFWKEKQRKGRNKEQRHRNYSVTENNMRSMHSSEKNWRNGLRARRLPMWCFIIVWNGGGTDKEEIWETHHKHIFMGAGKYDNKHGRWYLTEQEVETKNNWHRVRSTNVPSLHHNRGQPPTHQTDWVYISPTRDMRTTTSKNVQDDREGTRQTAKKYVPIVGGDFNAELGPGCGTKCTGVGKHTLNGGNKRGDWNETVADVARLHSTQHDVQKDTWETNELHISKKSYEKQIDTWDTPWRCRGHRHDPHAKWPQMCHGYFHDHHAWKEHPLQEYHEKTGHDWVWGTRPSKKNHWRPWSLSSKYREIIEKIIIKTATTNNDAAQAESEARIAQAKEKKAAAAAGAICENAEAKTEEVERMCKGNIMSDSVVTANETGGWHRGRTILSTASEDEDHIAFNNDHIKHDMNDDPKENEKSAEVTGEEHLDQGTVNDDADNVETAKEVGGRRRGRPVLRTVNEEDDFTVFHNDHVEHNTDDGMDENKKSSTIKKKWKLIHRNHVDCRRGDCKGVRWWTFRSKHKKSGNRSHPGWWSPRSVPTLGRWGRFYRVTCQQQHERSLKRWWRQWRRWRRRRDSSSKRDWRDFKKGRGNPKTHRIEERYTQRRETTTERSEQKHQKMYQRQEKSEKTTSNPKNSRRLQRCQQHPRNQICKEESAH